MLPERVCSGLGFLAFPRFPSFLDLGGVGGFRVAEDVRMAVDHLARDRAGDLVEIEPATFPRQRGQEKDLEEEVAQLVPQRPGISRVQRVQGLVAFLQQIGLDRLGCLLPIPGAFPPQLLDERQQLGQRRHVPIICAGARVNARWVKI